MISIYSSAFNLLKNNFSYEATIDYFCSFATEVVIAVNRSEDDTLTVLQNLSKIKSNLIIIDTNFSYDDPLLDGKIKNQALQSTTQKFKIGLDMDEYIPLWQKPMWEELCDILDADSCDCYMIPSINLYKDNDHYFSITPKWYLHKSGLFRGPVDFARRNDGTVDTSRSDTCELIYANGSLVQSKMTKSRIEDLQNGMLPFVVHTGYVNLSDRLLRNKNFWQNHWHVESGGIAPPHTIHANLEDFQFDYLEHKLKL